MCKYFSTIYDNPIIWKFVMKIIWHILVSLRSSRPIDELKKLLVKKINHLIVILDTNAFVITNLKLKSSRTLLLWVAI